MTFIPLCPKCNKRMELRKCMGGKYWYCSDYAYDGGIIKDVKK